MPHSHCHELREERDTNGHEVMIALSSCVFLSHSYHVRECSSRVVLVRVSSRTCHESFKLFKTFGAQSSLNLIRLAFLLIVLRSAGIILVRGRFVAFSGMFG